MLNARVLPQFKVRVKTNQDLRNIETLDYFIKCSIELFLYDYFVYIKPIEMQPYISINKIFWDKLLKHI